MASKADVRRRCLGAFCLLAAIATLIAGESLLRNRLSPAAFLVFWAMCFVFSGLAVLIAMLDIAATRRRIRKEHRDLLESTFGQATRPKEPESRKPPESTDPSP